ncbi:MULTISPECIES: LysR family transcriptional regulator [Ferrimonas]|uniref:LysR family transcriptional regulator n=1 Tax=Ferrimonas TaxID=44011 RepID=UPI000482AE56|nr:MULTISPECIES: LysR family transcriptional regulator [Ferrimonas]USD38686.1 LysR family transcriptional regulator [Ferrimonas sp. SCSIO 43195]
MKSRSDDLQLLLAVVDSGGFSAAADALGIQVARVSRAVSRLEQQLGVTLLNRTTRRVELTEEGRQFVYEVRQGMAQLLHAEAQLQSRLDTPSGRLRVDAASPFIQHQLVPLIAEFQQQYPQIELELTSNEGYVDLLEKRCDVAIRIGPLTDSSLHARQLGRSALHLVASPDYLAQCGIPENVEQLLSHRLLGFVGTRALNVWPLPEVGEIRPAISSSNGEVLRQLVLMGNGIACLSAFMIQDDLAKGRLVKLLELQTLPHTDRELVNAVYYRTTAIPSRIRAFLDFIEPRLTL